MTEFGYLSFMVEKFLGRGFQGQQNVGFFTVATEPGDAKAGAQGAGSGQAEHRHQSLRGKSSTPSAESVR